MKRPRFSVIVCTLNRSSVLGLTLQSLRNQTLPLSDYEVIVVDDCSSDDTQDVVRVQSWDSLIYLQHSENRGRVATRNTGISAAHGDFILFLDDDCVPDNKLLESHLRAHIECVEAIAVMGSVRYPGEEVQKSNFTRFMDSQYIGSAPRSKINYSHLPGRCFGTGNASVRAESLARVGGFDENFRYYGAEDLDLGLRLEKSGIRLIYCDDAKVCHHDQVTISRVKTKSREVAREGLSVLLGKDPNALAGSFVQLLLPIQIFREQLTVSLKKIVTRLLVNGATQLVLECWARWTDAYPKLYFPSLLKILQACWYREGFRQPRGTGERVAYPPSPASNRLRS